MVKILELRGRCLSRDFSESGAQIPIGALSENRRSANGAKILGHLSQDFKKSIGTKGSANY